MKKLLILDLDETLISSAYEKPLTYDFCFILEKLTYYVKIRPNLDAFLNFCFEHFNVAIWSAGDEDYVNKIVGYIFKDRQNQLLFIWSKKKCTIIVKTYNFYEQIIIRIKNLKKIWRKKGINFDKTNTLILDDTPNTYTNNYGNAIRIKEFETNAVTDSEFERIKTILLDCINETDVRLIKKKIYF